MAPGKAESNPRQTVSHLDLELPKPQNCEKQNCAFYTKFKKNESINQLNPTKA